MQEDPNIDLADKNISFPKYIVEKNKSILGEHYWEELELVTFKENKRLRISKKDFETIKLKFGFVVSETIDELILNLPTIENVDNGEDALQTKPKRNTVTNLLKAIGESAKTGFKQVSKTEFDKRKALCSQCKYWSAKAFVGLGKCNVCGCSGIKLKLSTSSCPIGKW